MDRHRYRGLRIPKCHCFAPDYPEPQSPPQAIDGNPKTRYTTGPRVYDGTEEFSVAFPSSVTISGNTVDPGNSSDYAIAYALEFSTDGLTFVPFSPPITGPGVPDPPLVCGFGSGGGCTMAIPFPPTVMKAIKFKQTGSAEGHGWWSIAEFNVIACEES